jgi:hypothetical protein
MVQLIGIGSTDTRWAAAASERKRLKHADHAKRFQARRAQGVVAGTSMTSWRMKSSGKSWHVCKIVGRSVPNFGPIQNDSPITKTAHPGIRESLQSQTNPLAMDVGARCVTKTDSPGSCFLPGWLSC